MAALSRDMRGNVIRDWARRGEARIGTVWKVGRARGGRDRARSQARLGQPRTSARDSPRSTLGMSTAATCQPGVCLLLRGGWTLCIGGRWPSSARLLRGGWTGNPSQLSHSKHAWRGDAFIRTNTNQRARIHCLVFSKPTNYLICY